MEFHEKLQELRKSKEMTQEELAEALFVSRTAISKWDSGRGYPSLDSLREISKFFSVTIDELLSGENLLTIAEQDKNAGIRKTHDLLLGLVDLFAVALVILPLYPETVGDYVYSVNLLAYEQASHGLALYWIMFVMLISVGIIKLLMIRFCPEKNTQIISDVSVGLNIIVLIVLVLSREVYASALLVMMLSVKTLLVLKTLKSEV